MPSTNKPTLTIEMWSDLTCPFCLIGKRKVEVALAQLHYVPYATSPSTTPVDAKTYIIQHRSFQLEPIDPRATDELRELLPEHLANKLHVKRRDAEQMLEDVAAMLERDVGLTFNWKIAKPGNTMDAHRIIHMAQEKGLGEVAREHLLRAYFTKGIAIDDMNALARIAKDIEGLSGSDIDDVLSDKTKYFADVREDESRAKQLGVSQVPYFVFNEGMAATNSDVDPLELTKIIWSAVRCGHKK